jgi:hypothetical protein
MRYFVVNTTSWEPSYGQLRWSHFMEASLLYVFALTIKRKTKEIMQENLAKIDENIYHDIELQVLGSRSSARAVSFLYALLAWNPAWRSTAQEALKHSYFRFGSFSHWHRCLFI